MVGTRVSNVYDAAIVGPEKVSCDHKLSFWAGFIRAIRAFCCAYRESAHEFAAQAAF